MDEAAAKIFHTKQVKLRVESGAKPAPTPREVESDRRNRLASTDPCNEHPKENPGAFFQGWDSHYTQGHATLHSPFREKNRMLSGFYQKGGAASLQMLTFSQFFMKTRAFSEEISTERICVNLTLQCTRAHLQMMAPYDGSE